MPDCCRKSAVAWLVACNTCWAHFGFHCSANAFGTSPDDGMPSVPVRLLQSIRIFQKPSFKGTILYIMFSCCYHVCYVHYRSNNWWFVNILWFSFGYFFLFHNRKGQCMSSYLIALKNSGMCQIISVYCFFTFFLYLCPIWVKYIFLFFYPSWGILLIEVEQVVRNLTIQLKLFNF